MASNIETLLLEVSKILKEHEQNRIKKGDDFNIFKITGIQSDEVKMCRMLAEIIDPMGSHNAGNFFLRPFIRNVLNIDVDEDELSSARVYVEYHTVEDRRIDIVIETNRRFVPIEVKIYAEDQARQCKDYYDFAVSRNKSEQSRVYYLTIDGHLPQKSGTIGLTPIEHNNILVGYEEIVPLSFRRDICFWLERCLEEPEMADKVSLRTPFEQFLYVIREMSGNMNMKLNGDINQLITASSDNFAAASLIAESIQDAKKGMLFDLFTVIDVKLKMNGFPYEQIKNKFDFRYNNNEAVNKFYSRGKTWPALTYRCKKIDETKEIWFRIEVEHNLYCGFVIAENGDNPGEMVMSHEEIEKHIKVPHGFYEDSWWFYWEYLLNDNEKSTPNFMKGDVIMQKTFVVDLFSKKTARNNGDLPMYLVKDHHIPIIEPAAFDKVQIEIAKRNSLKAMTDKGITPNSRFSGKYALTGLVECGNCGSKYRRTTWSKRGKKKVVWRCISRLEYGTKYCNDSSTIEEERLHNGILKAINMMQKNAEEIRTLLYGTIAEVLASSNTDKEMLELKNKIDMLNKEMMQYIEDEVAKRTSRDEIEAYCKEKSREIQILQDRLNTLNAKHQMENLNRNYLTEIYEHIAKIPGELKEYNDTLARLSVTKVKILSEEKMEVTLYGTVTLTVDM